MRRALPESEPRSLLDAPDTEGMPSDGGGFATLTRGCEWPCSLAGGTRSTEDDAQAGPRLVVVVYAVEFVEK